MKTINNVQKAIIKSLAIVISLVLISFTVSAQDFWKAILKNNSLNEIAMFMVDSNPGSASNQNAPANSKGADATAALMVTETEEVLELEDWMINENYFVPATVSMELDSENPMELESWMTDGNYFVSNAINFENETEKPLQLENWMVDNKFWKR